ncbi:PRC-barrel domain-containing protein [Roseinatronobacter alkalisoli]|uniref:PRC-barrel domain-containing protein n=1 Tax=Roseinatronobacter alkalisoli TaxID=3028235 RepID=A0ABT5TBH5_9RHOB|nr:PRC-barrel domain-containing protein [Roseinatronobacter sp. HJB301]MDD7972351.1 PRC-barrel domain-containing protein [Roseinatronobacter sp. HJB301]
MNKLLSTTALVLALGVPGMAFAQTTGSAAQTETQQQNGTGSAFMSARGESDIFASELMGQNVYARLTGQNEARSNDGQSSAAEGQAAAADGQARADDNQARQHSDGGGGMSMMNPSDLENMEHIGQINEIILSNDGQVRALIVGVGGFLGLGEQDIAVTMDQITFASDADDRSQIYVMVNADAEMLTEAPAYDRTAAMTDATADAEGTQQDQRARTGFAAPQVDREGYVRAEAGDVSTEMLIGEEVYDMNDETVGTVDDMILDEDGTITSIIIDFGGFLGIGSSQASIGFDELSIMTTEGFADVRIYVDASKDQIQELPRYQASN